MENVYPTWGYAANGDAKIFELRSGEGLPEGWKDHPNKWAEADEPVAQEPDADSSGAQQELEPEPQQDAADEPAGFSDDYLSEIIASEDKTALDAFAEEKGIKLDRRKSFDKMLADYNEAVA